jgi:hypothetical protein
MDRKKRKGIGNTAKARNYFGEKNWTTNVVRFKERVNTGVPHKISK